MPGGSLGYDGRGGVASSRESPRFSLEKNRVSETENTEWSDSSSFLGEAAVLSKFSSACINATQAFHSTSCKRRLVIKGPLKDAFGLSLNAMHRSVRLPFGCRRAAEAGTNSSCDALRSCHAMRIRFSMRLGEAWPSERKTLQCFPRGAPLFVHLQSAVHIRNVCVCVFM